jgi:integrase
MAPKRLLARPDLRRARFSLEQVRHYLLVSWKPLHGWPIHRVERKHVAIRLGELQREGHTVSAARARSALSTVFSWAIAQGIVDTNPVIGTSKPKDATKRERVLTDSKLAQVWKACRDDDSCGCIVKLLILTGQRRDEVGAMTQAELARDTGKWSIPANRTKNGRAHVLPLPPVAWDIINTVTRHKDYLFGRRAGGYSGWATGKKTLDARIKEGSENGIGVAPWVIHDLRRTVATRIADLGIATHVIEALLNHISGHKAGVAGIYNRSSYESELRNALAMWADHIRQIAEGPERRILQFSA